MVKKLIQSSNFLILLKNHLFLNQKKLPVNPTILLKLIPTNFLIKLLNTFQTIFLLLTHQILNLPQKSLQIVILLFERLHLILEYFALSNLIEPLGRIINYLSDFVQFFSLKIHYKNDQGIIGSKLNPSQSSFGKCGLDFSDQLHHFDGQKSSYDFECTKVY